jgi:hypothetical protein
VETKDIFKPNDKKRLCDLRYLMKKLESEADARELDYRQANMQRAADIFNQCCHVIELPLETGNNRQRRTSQIAWRTVVNLLRKQERAIQNQN